MYVVYDFLAELRAGRSVGQSTYVSSFTSFLVHHTHSWEGGPDGHKRQRLLLLYNAAYQRLAGWAVCVRRQSGREGGRKERAHLPSDGGGVGERESLLLGADAEGRAGGRTDGRTDGRKA